MTVTKNICERFSSHDFTSQWFDKVSHTLNNMGVNVVYIFSFFIGVSSFESYMLKKMFATKNPKRGIDKDFLNIPQATDKAKSRVGVDALLACFN
jgi:hypothetical protein